MACPRTSLWHRHRLAPLVALALVALLSLAYSAHAEQPPHILAAQAVADTVWGLWHDGSTLPIAQHPGKRVRHASLSPDGTACAYWLLPGPDVDASSVCRLHLIDLLSGGTTTLASESMPVGAPVWSPDGSRLAWVGNGALHTLRVTDAPRALRNVQFEQLEPPLPCWDPEGQRLYLVARINGQHGLWRIDGETAGSLLLTPLSETGPHPLDSSPNGAVALGDGRSIMVLPNASADPQPAPYLICRLDAPVVDLAYGADGDAFAALAADGRLHIVRPVTGQRATHSSEIAWHALSSLDSGQPGWLLRSVSARGIAFARIGDPNADLTPLGRLAVGAEPVMRSLSVAPAALADPGYRYYRYQGEWNSGSMAHSNCGPSCVAMAIQFARGNLWVAISDIRDQIGGTSWTYPSQLQGALAHWDVPSHALPDESALLAAITDPNRVVLLHLYMNWFPPGADYLWAYSDPALHHDRYYAYDSSHWVLVRGLSDDGVWAVCHDPNVWDGNGSYWYQDGSPKGENRHYALDQLLGSARAYDYQAIAVSIGATPTRTASPSPTVSPTPTLTPTQAATPTATATYTPGPPTSTPTWSAYPLPDQIHRILLPLIWSPGSPPAPTPTPTPTQAAPYPQPTLSLTLEPTLPTIDALVTELDGRGIVYSYDGTRHLGLISSDENHYDAIINPIGPYGRADSPCSIHNREGAYGSLTSDTSAYSPSAQQPPIIWVWEEDHYDMVAYLTMNTAQNPRLDPNDLLEALARLSAQEQP